MLLDAKELRWFGIDMCSRERRRIAVALTYAAYLFVVWVHPPYTYEVVTVLWWIALNAGLGKALEEAFSAWVSRLVVVCSIVLLCVLYFWKAPHHASSNDFIAPLYAAMLL
jgi:hypothetical protein